MFEIISINPYVVVPAFCQISIHSIPDTYNSNIQPEFVNYKDTVYTLTYQKYSYRPKFPFTFSHIYLLIKESTH